MITTCHSARKDDKLKNTIFTSFTRKMYVRNYSYISLSLNASNNQDAAKTLQETTIKIEPLRDKMRIAYCWIIY